jgi:pyruvate kinase
LRSRIPLVAFTPEASVRSQLALTWGVETFLTASVSSTDEMVSQVDEQLLHSRRCVPGDQVVIVAGSPPGVPGSLNTMRIHTLNEHT